MEYEVNANRQYLIQALRVRGPNGDLLSAIDINLRQLDMGVWFPQSISGQLHAQPLDDGVPSIKRFVSEFSDCEVNIPVPSEEFVLEFPTGVRVTDLRR